MSICIIQSCAEPAPLDAPFCADHQRLLNSPDEAAVERARKSVISYVFSEAQPDRGDVFSWVDDHADAIARAALTAALGVAAADGGRS